VTSAAEILELERRFLSPSTRIPFIPLVADSGEGTELVDRDGNRFLDFHSMACTVTTGHCHPRIVRAIQRQSERLVACNSGYALHEDLVRLAAELAEIAPGGGPRKVAFGLSGSDANDGALKLVRAATGRPKVVAFLGSYHGNTYGALSLSAVSLAMRRGFAPVVPEIHHIPYPDVFRCAPGESPDDVAKRCLAALDTLLETVAPPEEVAAIFLEPIQGDSGILVPPASFLAGLTEICRRHGILIVAEEVQSGIGRTGRWFASEHFDLEPDVLVVGKGLASGMPVSAVVARAELMDSWSPPGHVFSTAANPVCAAAARATLETIREDDLLENARQRGAQLVEGLEVLAGRHEAIGDVRGLGLMLGVDLVEDRVTRAPARALAAKVVVACYRRGLYLTFLRGCVLRLAPALTLDADAADRALTILDEALDDALSGRVSDAEAAAITGW
jgi:4-aminobutyrate aminotransferase